MFYMMERICENYMYENLLCMLMHMHGAGVHLRCINNNPRISSIIHLFTVT